MSPGSTAGSWGGSEGFVVLSYPGLQWVTRTPVGGMGRLHLLLTQVLLSQDTFANTPRSPLPAPEYHGSMEVTPGMDLRPHPALSGLGLVKRPAFSCAAPGSGSFLFSGWRPGGFCPSSS